MYSGGWSGCEFQGKDASSWWSVLAGGAWCLGKHGWVYNRILQGSLPGAVYKLASSQFRFSCVFRTKQLLWNIVEQTARSVSPGCIVINTGTPSHASAKSVIVSSRLGIQEPGLIFLTRSDSESSPRRVF